ncbi:hypothetical protein T265_09439 [Opisthorchis viverrini]|uniref:Uncharacterized protein n=1 Tax=Opisthorchis viverrini TaxID=6198 RepID=A0A074ZA74_OPIVI|nr:hypothetical protein T265_09439 [Opisthorchis viverrini]KER22492.1 hypothetical protein T265_09439 [Opisthorchis viverrini]
MVETTFSAPLIIDSSHLLVRRFDSRSSVVPAACVDCFCAHIFDFSDDFLAGDLASASAFPDHRVVESPPASRYRNFASQFSFFPEQWDAFSQTAPTMSLDISGSSLRDLCSVSCCTDDLPAFSSLLLQSVSVTDFRELMVEHYYAPAREPILVSDFSVQRVSEIVRRREERTDEDLLGEAEQAGVAESRFGVGAAVLPFDGRDYSCLFIRRHVNKMVETTFSAPLIIDSSHLLVRRFDSRSSVVPAACVDCFCAHIFDFGDDFLAGDLASASAFPDHRVVESPPASRCRNFASQFSFFPEQWDAFSQTAPTMSLDISGSSLRDLCSVSCCTDDLPAFSSLLLQSVSVTDFRELMVEHYYAPAREPILVSDFSVQVTPSIPHPVASMFWFEHLSSDELSMMRSTLLRYFNFDAYHAGLRAERTCEVACSAEDWGPEDSALYLSKLHSGLVAEVGLQARCNIGIQEPITHSDFLEVLETFRTLSTNQQFYTARQRHGLLKDKACFKKEQPRCLADIGVQVESPITISDLNLDSPEYRSGSPESTANTYENYLIRNRLGQICEQQSHTAPLVCPAATQTEAESFLRFSSIHEVPYESFETYERRLLRDEVAETFTQLDSETEITDDGRYDEKELQDITEEVTERNRKRIVSKVQITEEVTDDTELVVCELGIQADLQNADAEPFTTLDTRPPSQAVWTRARGNQTDPINLSALKSSSDFGWADPDLYAVILAGIAASRQRDYDSCGLSGDVGMGGTDRRTDIWATQGRESPKIMITIGCQTSLLGTVAGREPIRWTDVPKPSQALLKTRRTDYGEEENLVRRLSFTSSQDSRESPTSLMIVQLRQRIIQYELFEARSGFPEASWNNIREVASPTTGLFAPVATALRRGWISLGDRNEYINPATGETMSLAAAYQLGRIRLASTPMSSRRGHEHAVSELLLIERTCFNWRKVRLVSIVDTARGDTLEPEAARDVGILEVTGNEIRFLDTMTNTWLTIEEGVGRQMIEVVDVETSADTSSTEEEEPASCRVFFLTQLCPGGEPSAWMSPMEAERFGLFNWETGDVAADWPARPLLSDSDPTGQWPLSAFIPTKWCSFLTARHAGWLRLVEEPDPSKWIITHSVPYQEPNAVLLSTQVNLVAYTSAQTTETTEDVQQRLLALNQARSEEVYPQQPPNSEAFATLDFSPQLPETERSRSYNQVEIEETSNATYTVHRRQIHRRPYATSRQRYHSGGNPPSSDSISPKQLQRG